MQETFKSKIGIQIKSFIEYKRAQGYSYTSRLCYFIHFDQYCLDNGNPELVSKEFLETFIDLKLEKMNSPYRSWLSLFREFTKYLVFMNDKNTYILSSKYVIKHIYTNPYCLTENEIDLFFKNCFQLYPNLEKHLIVPIYLYLLN